MDNQLEDSEEAASGVEGREDSASMMDTQLLESGEAVPIMEGREESARRMDVQQEDSGSGHWTVEVELPPCHKTENTHIIKFIDNLTLLEKNIQNNLIQEEACIGPPS